MASAGESSSVSSHLQLLHDGRRHPLVEDFLLQFPDCEDDLAERAFLVYQNLTEVQEWWFTELAYSEDLDRPYVIGQMDRDSHRQAFLPVSVEERISLSAARYFLNKILVDEKPQKMLYLAIIETDTTMVFYKLTSGLCPPPQKSLEDEEKERMKARSQNVKESRAVLRHQSNQYVRAAVELAEEEEEQDM